MQATAHACIWTVTHRPLPPAAPPAAAPTSSSRGRRHHDSGTDLTNEDVDHDTPTATPEWIHPPTSVYTLGTRANPSLPAAQHPNHAWLATSAALRGNPTVDALPGATRSTLAQLESLLLNHLARPLALYWLPTARTSQGQGQGQGAGQASVYVPLDTGVLVRLSITVNPWIPATDLADVVLDATLADAGASAKTVRDEYRNWTLATRRQVESVHESAAKRVAANLTSTASASAPVPVRWGAAVVAPHFVACYVPSMGKVRVYFSVNRHKLVKVEWRAMGTPTMVEVDVGKEVSGGAGGAGDAGGGGGKVRLETMGEHLAAVGERSVAMYQIRETSGVMQVNPTSKLAFGTDTLRVAHLSWGSTLLALIQSSTPTLDGTTELWIRGYAFNAKSRMWDELDAHGPVLSLPAAETGDISAWAVGEPVLTGSSASGGDGKAGSAAQSANRPASTRSKAARAHAMPVLLGTSTGKLMHIAVQFSPSSVSWTQVELTHPVTPLAPSGIAHLAMHPGGCFVAAVDTLGRVAVVDLIGKPVSVRHAFTSSSPTSTAKLIHPLQTLGFNAPPSLVSWSPPPPPQLNPPAPLPGQRTYVPTLAPPTPSTLLLVFDRGPFAALTFDLAPTTTSLKGYARHLLARGQPGWSHVMHLAKHLALHSPSDIASLGHMLLAAVPTTPGDPMAESGAYHTQILSIATRVLDAAPTLASAVALARKIVHAHLAHGRLERALSAAAAASPSNDACTSDLLHLIALSAAQLGDADARGLAAAAHFQFLKMCPGPYPPLLAADPTPTAADAPCVDHLVELYTRQVAPIAAGTRPAFGVDVKRLAAYLEVSGEREEAMRWWRRVHGYEEEGRRGWERIGRVVGWYEGKRREDGEGR